MLDKHYDSGPAPDEQSLSPLPHRPRPRAISEEMLRTERPEDGGRAGQVVFWTRCGHGAHELTAVEISCVRFAQDQSRPNPSVDGIDDL